jgi:hypothetical protein
LPADGDGAPPGVAGAPARLDGLGVVGGRAAVGAAAAHPGQAGGARQEQEVRHARHQADHREERGGGHERPAPTQELLGQRDPELAVVGAGDQEGRAGRHQERRDLRHQAVADRQDREGAGGVAERHVALGDADDDAADDVDREDEQAGDRVAADELRGAVHRAVEVGLALDLAAALARGALVDEASAQIGVDRHLLAGHRVEGEAGRDLGDALGALGDDDEVHDHQDQKDDRADDEIAADRERAERRDHRAGRVVALPPWVRINRVEATLSARRNRVTNRSRAGNAEKSVGRST